MINEKLEQAKDIMESLAARKIGGAGIQLSGEETELAYEIFNDYVKRNDPQGLCTKLPFEVISSLKEVS